MKTFQAVTMTSIDKIIFALVMVQVVVVLAKPYEPQNGDQLQPFYGVREYFVYKRAASCNIEGKHRVNCGHGGISKADCEKKGCCFDDSIRNVPWCFKTADCGIGCEPEGCFSRRCRPSCRSGEDHISMYDNKCAGADKCCMCHVGRNMPCAYDA